MKKQGYNARLDESLGARNGKKKQSLKSRRRESEGEEKAQGKRKYAGNKSMGYVRASQPLATSPRPVAVGKMSLKSGAL